MMEHLMRKVVAGYKNSYVTAWRNQQDDMILWGDSGRSSYIITLLTVHYVVS